VKYHVLTFTLLILLGSQLYSQKSWTLKECIQFAIEHNLVQSNYQLRQKNSLLESHQAKYNLLPSLNGNSNAGTNFGKGIDHNNNIINTEFFRASGSLNARLDIFRGFTRLNYMGYTKFKLLASQNDTESHRDDLAFDILNTYYDVVYFDGMQDIAAEQLKVSEYNLKKTQTEIEIGLKAKSDVAQMQAAFEREKLDLLMAQNNYELARLKLKQSMNLRDNDGFNLSINDEIALPQQPEINSGDSLLTVFSNFSPELKLAEANMNAANKNVRMAQGNFLPTLSLNASVGSDYYSTSKNADGNTIAFNEQVKNNTEKYIGASLSIPIFNKMQQRTNVKVAKINRQIAEQNYEDKKLQTEFEINNNLQQLQARYSKYIQSERQLEANKISYEVAQRKYEEGLINIIELLTEKERYSDARIALLQSKIEWEIKDKTIQFYLGNRFWE